MNLLMYVQSFLGVPPLESMLKYEYITGSILLILYSWGLIMLLLNFQKSFNKRG